MEDEKARSIYNVTPDHVRGMSNDAVQQAIASNLNYARNAEARLTIQVKEATRRGMAVTAEMLAYSTTSERILSDE